MKVCAVMIVKNEQEHLPACLASVLSFADHIVVVDTGSTDGTQAIVEATPKTSFHVYLDASEQGPNGWQINDFSKARNFAIGTAEACYIPDFLFTVDADDVIEKPEAVRALIEKGDADAWDFQIVDGFTEVKSTFNHMRLWRAYHGVAFAGACHEVPILPEGMKLKNSGLRILHRWDQQASVEPSTSRNLRILKRQYEAGDKGSRTLFYLANSYRDCGMWPEAITTYHEYLATGGGWHDEQVFARLYLARCHRFHGQLELARAEAFRGLALDSRFSEFYMELAYLGQISNHISTPHFARLALQPKPPTPLFQEHNKYTDQPWRTLAWWFENHGELAEAAKAYQEVLKLVPGDLDMVQALARVTGQSEVLHVNRPGAAGDILCALAAVDAYKIKNPDRKVIFHSHPSFRCLVEACLAVDGWADSASLPAGTVNLIGYPIAEGHPTKRVMNKHLVRYFSAELGLTDSAFFMTPAMRLPTQPFIGGTYATIQTTAGWSPYKEWPLERWQEIADRLGKLGWHVVQVGGPDDKRLASVDDMCGKITWLESYALINQATLHLGIDSFGAHACREGVILYGSTDPKCFGYAHNVNIWRGLDCSPCYRDNPKVSGIEREPCPHTVKWDEGRHPCMEEIDVETVWTAIQDELCLP
jgi:glycosyltransferase involved in cell wall biosynthesis